MDINKTTSTSTSTIFREDIMVNNPYSMIKKDYIIKISNYTERNNDMETGISSRISSSRASLSSLDVIEEEC
jgi:hypothetical protein